MHQEETPTFQLSWHLRRTSILCHQTQNIIKKKGGKYIQEGGLGLNPHNKNARNKNN